LATSSLRMGATADDSSGMAARSSQGPANSGDAAILGNEGSGSHAFPFKASHEMR
jgi:hypothetical protein